MSLSVEPFTVEGRQRALLYRRGAYPGVRSALWLELGSALPYGHPFHGAVGVWITESASGALGCFTSLNPPNGRSLGGRVVHHLAVLDSDAHWVEVLARAQARAAATLAEAEQGALQQALDAFIAELDAEVMAAVRADGEATPVVYNHYAQNNERLRRNRQQAAVTHPRFAQALRNDWSLRRAVDGERPLTQTLAHHYRVRESSIRQARACSARCLPTSVLATRLKQLDRLPTSAVPKTPADWAVYSTLADGLEALVERAGLPRSSVLKPFHQGWVSGLRDLEQSLRAPLDLDAIQELMHCTYHYGVVPVVERALTETGLRGALAQRPPAAFFPLWFSHYGLRRLAQMANRWQQVHGELSLTRLGAIAERAPSEALSWPSLLGTGATHDGVRLVELTSHAALELEGQRLEHCVASYAIKCLLEESAIFSLRDTTGEPLATIEVHVPTRGAVTVLQQHARANQPPSARLQAIAERFVGQVLERLPRAHIAAVQQQRRALGLRVRHLLGKPDTLQEPLEAHEQARLAEAIAFAHPAPVRHQGLLSYLQTEGAPVLAAMRDA